MKQKNIEDLTWEQIRIAGEMKPRVIICENVKGLTMEYAREHLTATSGHNFDVDDVIVKATQLFSELKGIHPVHKAKEHAVNLAFDLNSDSNSDVKEAVPAQTIYDLIADTDETTIEYEGTTYALTPYYDMSNIEAIKLMIDTYHAFLPTKGNSEK